MAAVLLLAPPAGAENVAVVVVPPFQPAAYASRGAVGLMPPGDGTTVSRKSAVAALVRGRTKKSVLGGVPGGKPLITLSTRPKAITIYVSLPPPGVHRNDVRYSVAIVGGGYRGILDSTSTRIPGLVSIADIAPTAVDLTRGKKPPIGWQAGTTADLRTLDRTLRRQQRARDPAVAILSFAAILLAVLALLLRSARLGRSCLLAAPLALGVAVALSAADVTRVWTVLVGLAVLTAALSIAGGLLPGRKPLAVAFLCLIAAYFVVLLAEPTWAALASIGPNPGEGGRFYGCTNLTSSIVLTVALFTGAAFGLRGLLPVAVLAIATVGWSETGADGGGTVALAAGFVALAARLATGRLTVRAVTLSGAVAVAVALLVVGLDAATGGSSHVTRRVGEGPGAAADEVGNRLHISVDRLVDSWHAALVFAVAIAALVVLVTRRPRFPAGDALLVGIVVSLLVNDTPQHVAAAGAISYGVLWAHERVTSGTPCD
jgi:hypothetical protein